MKKYSIVIGIANDKLKNNEISYMKEYCPLGVILFSRNIVNKKQTQSLIEKIKNILGDNALILIDQEGGRVSRLLCPEWPPFPSAKTFGNIAKKDLRKAEKATFENFKNIGKHLNFLGINYNCAPVLDLSIRNSNKIIGDRAFSRDPFVVARLGKKACDGLKSSNIIPIIKHIPGHGRSLKDSHLELPIINLDLKKLGDDFYPFFKLNDIEAAMTGHLKFSKIDENCVTHSELVIKKIIREKIGFKGLLFSDDLCMKALKGSYISRAKKAINSGCDIVLHCQPDIKNIINSTIGAGKVSKKTAKKITTNFKAIM